MYIYNVTVSVNSEIEKDWLKWMNEVHIPEVLDTGYFAGHEMFRVLLNKEDNSVSYSIQYRFSEMKDLQLYQANAAPALQAKHNERYKDKCLAFRSILEKVY